MRTARDRAGSVPATSTPHRAASLPPRSAAAVFASRAEIPIRIAPVTSFSSAQRPVSSSSSSQRASCFGSSVLPSVRSVVTTSVRVEAAGCCGRSTARPPPPRAQRVAGRGRGWGVCRLLRWQRFLRDRPPTPPTPPRRCAGGGEKTARGTPRPHQRHRLREIADVIIGQREQHRIGALGDQVADQAGLGVLERQRAGQRGERVAAVGVADLAKIARSAAAACCCGRARRRGGRAVRQSGSCLGVPGRAASASSSSP